LPARARGLVVYAAPNPFRRRVSVEYGYGGVYVESQYPIAPLVEALDAYALVLVEDLYSVWPQAKIFPRISAYRELVRGLEAYMERSCTLRLPPKACMKTVYRVVPSLGVMGAWEFSADPYDTLLFTLAHTATLALRLAPERIIAVIDQEAPAMTQTLSVAAAAAWAHALGKRLETVYAPARPYPPGEHAYQELWELPTPLCPTPCTQEEGSEGLEILVPKPNTRIEKITRKIAVINKKFMHTLQAGDQGSHERAKTLAQLLEEAINLYIEATVLLKKKKGGKIYHTVRANPQALVKLTATLTRSNTEPPQPIS